MLEHVLQRSWSPGQRILVVAAALLFAGALIHVGAWRWFGGSLVGAVSWRKPILFCVSSAVTCLSLAWLLGGLAPTRLGRPVAALFSLAIVGEVGLICLQQWRGVPSHFNQSTPLDALILAGIKWQVAIVTLLILFLTLRSLGPTRWTPDLQWAARAGMVLLLMSCLLGFLIEYQGENSAARGAAPGAYGAAGVLKFPHGMPMHAIQLLPLLAYMLQWIGVDGRRRLQAVQSATLGIVGLTTYALLQTYSGRSRFDLTSVSAVVLCLSLVCLAIVPLVLALLQDSRGEGVPS